MIVDIIVNNIDDISHPSCLPYLRTTTIFGNAVIITIFISI